MSAEAQSRRHLLDGVVRVFLGEALFFPTGLLTVAFLTRRLGPEGYGLLALAMTPVLWVEWSVVALFSRATVKLTGDAGDWRPVGATVVRLHLAAGLVSGLLVVLLAGPLASLLGEPALTEYLRVLALDIPLVALIHAHRSLLVGTGDFRSRAVAAAARWIGRLLLIVLFVQMGLSIFGALLGNIGASLIELAIVRSAVRPPILGRVSMDVRAVWVYAAPLFLSAVSLRLLDRLDLLMLKTLGTSTAQVGVYGAAQNLAFAPRIFALSLSSLLLATLARMLRSGEGRPAAELGRDAERFALLILPLAGAAAGSAPGIVALVVGARYAEAAPWLAVLVFGAVASIALSVATAILTAADRAGWTVSLAWPLLPLATVGHLLAIPRAGALGAALVTVLCTVLGAVLGIVAVRRAWGILPPAATAVRSVLLTACAYGVSALWPTAGIWVLVELAVLVGGVGVGFVLVGEFKTAGRPTDWRVLLPRSFALQDPSRPE
jgi:O-antigen/teichoic acid export membrane protein